MTKEEEEALWRSRFIAVNVVRIGGTIVVLLGLVLWQSDTLVEGGSILGLPMALIGLFASFAGPQWLARRWRTPPGA